MLFDFFRRKKNTLSDEQQKWNKMWELWADGDIESPYNELMTYHGEVNNGGHAQYFTNAENCGDLPKDMAVLCEVLSEKLSENLKTAYKAHLVLEENEAEEAAEAVLKKCDDVFFKNEEEINKILEDYCKQM